MSVASIPNFQNVLKVGAEAVAKKAPNLAVKLAHNQATPFQINRVVNIISQLPQVKNLRLKPDQVRKLATFVAARIKAKEVFGAIFKAMFEGFAKVAISSRF